MPKGLTKINSPESFNQWTKQKPILDRECILITLSFLDNGTPTIQIFSVYEDLYNWGIFENGGEEWGDYDELEAEYYCILDYPERSEK